MHRPLVAIGFGVIGGLAGMHPGAIGAFCLVTLVAIDLATRTDARPPVPRRPPTTGDAVTDPTAHDQLTATLEVTAAFQRLVDTGLATEDPKGLNRGGLNMLSDLLAVLIFQAGSSPTTTGQVCSASSRATMSALADLLRGDEPTTPDTLQLLTAAVRTARTS